jgi:hypothetical protein
MKNVALILMLCFAGMAGMGCAVDQDESALTAEEQMLGDKEGAPGALYTRWQCGADTASVRNVPGGSVIYAQVYYGEVVDVLQRDGAWFRVYHYATGATGWTLVQYYC